MIISPETTRLVALFLTGILSGGGTYLAAKFVFEELATFNVHLSPRRKRMWVLPICALITLAAVVLQAVLGVAPLTPDGIFLALSVAFSASQLFHARELSTVVTAWNW